MPSIPIFRMGCCGEDEWVVDVAEIPVPSQSHRPPWSAEKNVSGETEVENRGAKVSWRMVHFLRDHLKNQPLFQDSH